MTTNKILQFLTLLSYAVVVSQSFMYILSLKNTQLALDATSYTAVRQLIDANMMGVFKYVMYATLLFNLILVATSVKTPSSMIFITSSIAFLALLADAILTLKGNMPLNVIINSWSPANPPSDWKGIREQWFAVFQYRQVLNITGFISLVVGVVFGK